MFNSLSFVCKVVQLKFLSLASPGYLRALQQRRLRRILRFASAYSPFYRERFRGINLELCRLSDLPVLTKAEMMAHFDELVTDRQVTRAGVERFIAEPASLGRPYLGRYAVCHTSGSEGQPALVVQERADMLLPFALQAARGNRQSLRPGGLLHHFWKGSRIAVVTQQPGFYPSGATFAYLAAAHLRRLELLRLSVFDSIKENVKRLHAFRPRVLIGYTSVLEALAHEEREQRLRLRETGCLEQVTNISEPLPAVSRETIEQAFGVPLTDQYAMAECTALTSGCPFHSGFHLNVDLAYLEVVDDRYQPVAAGEPGSRILVTNLYNRVQPFIRYEVGDVVTMSPSPCPCGSSLPLIQSVSGRTKERFWLRIRGEYRELPCYVFLAAMHHCLEIADHEVVQTGFNHFVVRVAPLPGKTVAPRRVAQLVQQSVDMEGLTELLDFEVEVVPELKPDPVSGKRQRVRNQIGPPPRSTTKPAEALQNV